MTTLDDLGVEDEGAVEGEDDEAARARKRRLRRKRRAEAKRRRRQQAQTKGGDTADGEMEAASASAGDPPSVDGAAGEGSIEMLKPGELPDRPHGSGGPAQLAAEWEAHREGEAAARRKAVEEGVQSAMAQEQLTEVDDQQQGHSHSHDHGADAPAPAVSQDLAAAPAGADADATPLNLDENGWPIYTAAPPRQETWVAMQRPRPGSNERSVTSHRFAEANVRSMNPPHPREGLPARIRAELSSRLVISMGQGVHSGRLNLEADGLGGLAIIGVMLKSFLPTAQAHHVYR